MSFIGDQIKNQAKGSIFFSLIRKARRLGIELDKKNKRWEDYKIYPSGLKSFSDCPVEFVKSLEIPHVIEDLDAVYRVKRGSAIHKEFQDSLLISDKIYPKPTNIQDERIKKKLEDNWPEVPFHSKLTRHSGSVDGVIRFKGKPTIIEIKTTSLDEERWMNHSLKANKGHIIQVLDYIYHLNMLEYYEEKIESAILCYVNLMYPPGELEAEKEYIIHWEDWKDEFIPYIESLTEQINAYINKEEKPCSNPFCRIHK